jgi:conjugative relaxase-like TrwC/TraI family protein
MARAARPAVGPHRGRPRGAEGYAAPQLHTHVVIFNVTERENGDTRALQPRELYKTQAYATAVYRAELATRLTAMGYEIARGESGQPDVRGSISCKHSEPTEPSTNRPSAQRRRASTP